MAVLKKSVREATAVNWPGPNAVVEFRRAADAFGAKIRRAKNPSAAARNLLVREGIVTPTGKLTSKYK